MFAVVSVIHVIVSAILIFLVLLHSGKDTGLSGLGGVGGGGGGPFGSGGAMLEKNLNRWTVGFALAFLITTIVLVKI